MRFVSIGPAPMQRTGPPNDSSSFASSSSRRRVVSALQTKRPPFHLAERLRLFETERRGEERVVPERRMKIERQMRAVERKIVVDASLSARKERAR